jgi:hypothetical protein
LSRERFEKEKGLNIESIRSKSKSKRAKNRKVPKLYIDDLVCGTRTEGEMDFAGVIPRRDSLDFPPRHLKGRGRIGARARARARASTRARTTRTPWESETTRQDRARQDKTRHDKTRQDKTRQGKTRQGKTKQDKTRQRESNHKANPGISQDKTSPSHNENENIHGSESG